MDNNFGKKKGREGEEREGKRNERDLAFVCVGANGRERKGDGVSLQIFPTLERLKP